MLNRGKMQNELFNYDGLYYHTGENAVVRVESANGVTVGIFLTQQQCVETNT